MFQLHIAIVISDLSMTQDGASRERDSLVKGVYLVQFKHRNDFPLWWVILRGLDMIYMSVSGQNSSHVWREFMSLLFFA